MITRHQHKADIYLDYLEKEISARSALFKHRLVTQIHWGGGTPTYLSEIQSARLMAMLKKHFTISETAEISIESILVELNFLCLIIYVTLVLTA